MAEPEEKISINSNVLAWVIIGLGGLTVALSLWDLLIEQDGGAGQSILLVLVGICVGALGFRWKRK